MNRLGAVLHFLKHGQMRLALTVLFIPYPYAITYLEGRTYTDFGVTRSMRKGWKSVNFEPEPRRTIT